MRIVRFSRLHRTELTIAFTSARCNKFLHDAVNGQPQPPAPASRRRKRFGRSWPPTSEGSARPASRNDGFAEATSEPRNAGYATTMTAGWISRRLAIPTGGRSRRARRSPMGLVFRRYLPGASTDGDRRVVVSFWDASQTPGPPRRICEIADAGRLALDQWTAGVVRLVEMLKSCTALHHETCRPGTPTSSAQALHLSYCSASGRHSMPSVRQVPPVPVTRSTSKPTGDCEAPWRWLRRSGARGGYLPRAPPSPLACPAKRAVTPWFRGLPEETRWRAKAGDEWRASSPLAALADVILQACPRRSLAADTPWHLVITL